MTRDEMREKVAKSGYEALRDKGHPAWEQADGLQRMCAFIIFDAMAAAIESTGHAIVPREPTEEMVKAGRGHLGSYMRDGTPHDGPLTPAVVYRAMLTACGQEGKS